MRKKKDKESPWISIKDDMPPDDENVLVHNVSMGSVGTPRIGWCAVYEEKPNFYLSHLDNGFPIQVSHWMPIPELPE